MKRVLHISTYYPPHIGGVEQVASDIVDSLKGKYEQVVLAFNHEKNDSVENVDGVTIYRCKPNFKVSSQAISLGYGKKLREIITDYKPDIIHFHFPNPFAAHYLLKCKNNAKIIVHYHSDIIKQKILKKFFVGQTKRLLNRAEKIVATSPQYIDYSEFLYKYKDKCIMLPNCINENRLAMTDEDVNESKRLKDVYRDKIVCLFVGRHVPYKGLIHLIKAAKFIDNNIVIRIAGAGPLTENLKKEAEGATNIEFIGAVKQLNSNFDACDIFTFPSITKNEAFGIALAEAMWFSKPAITFYIEGSGVNYVGLKNETCLECENGNEKQFAEAINKLAQDEVLRNTLGQNALKRVESLFTFAHFKENVENLYERVIDENRD